jgi:hypothetical protein
VVMEITAEFALASELHLNHKKTMVIALNPDRDVTDVELPDRLSFMDQRSCPGTWASKWGVCRVRSTHGSWRTSNYKYGCSSPGRRPTRSINAVRWWPQLWCLSCCILGVTNGPAPRW